MRSPLKQVRHFFLLVCGLHFFLMCAFYSLNFVFVPCFPPTQGRGTGWNVWDGSVVAALWLQQAQQDGALP